MQTDLHWPPLPLAAWRDTLETLHRYTQVIGKLQLATTPRVCHFWNVMLTPTARGLATAALPSGGRTFDVEFDFVEHVLTIRSSDGGRRAIPLGARTVAAFYDEVMAALGALDFHVAIWPHPVELVSDAIPFQEDKVHRAYDPAWVTRFWRALSHVAEVLVQFRSRFIGKSSPVGFYWGTFDMSVSRYSGKRAIPAPEGTIDGEAFSHELSEVGFWPGDGRYEQPAFYAMHAPAPEGYARTSLQPAAWNDSLRCFLLPYEVVRTAAEPDALLLEFFENAYAAGADLAGWNRAELERR